MCRYMDVYSILTLKCTDTRAASILLHVSSVHISSCHLGKTSDKGNDPYRQTKQFNGASHHFARVRAFFTSFCQASMIL